MADATGRLCVAYRGFYLVGVVDANGETTRRLTMRERLDMLGIRVPDWLSPIVFILVAGPIVLKMMIGKDLGTIRLMARRPRAVPKLEESAVLQR